jgi:hypothetical protein
VRASTESAFALAEGLNKKKTNESQDGIYSSKSAISEDESEEVIIEKTKGKRKKKEMTFVDKESEDEETKDKI